MRAIVLAAGKGSRLHSEKHNMPKVLRKVVGQPLIKYVLDHLSFIPEKDIFVVVGYRKDMVIRTIKGDYKYVIQKQQLGTGHAVKAAEEYFKGYDGDVIVAYGDMPLYSRNTYEEIIKKHKAVKSKCTVLTAVDEKSPAYGRIIRNEKGELIDIVEQKDCTEEQLNIKELNVGMYVFNSKFLFENLRLLKNNNSQNEYYLTDIPKIMLKNGEKVYTHTIYDTSEIYGVNTQEDLVLCEKVLKERGESND